MTRRHILLNARDAIFSQPVPKRVQVSAWRLYCHELENHRTPKTALRNVLLWLEEQKCRADMAKQMLTPRQRQMTQMLVNGMPYKQIARRLGVKIETVKLTLSNAKERLGVETVYQLVALSVQEGWVRAKHP